MFAVLVVLVCVVSLAYAAKKGGQALNDDEVQWMQRQRTARAAANDAAAPEGARQAMAAADEIDKMLGSLEAELKTKDAAAATAAKSIAATAAALGGAASAGSAANNAAANRNANKGVQSSASSTTLSTTATIVEPAAAASAGSDALASNVISGSAVLELNMRNFDDHIAKINDGMAVFVQFYADWCNHCKNIAPIWSRLAELYRKDPRVLFARVNGDNNDRLMARYSIEGYPNMLLFTKAYPDGELYRGYRTFETMLKWYQDRVGTPIIVPKASNAEYHARLAEFNRKNKDILQQPPPTTTTTKATQDSIDTKSNNNNNKNVASTTATTTTTTTTNNNIDNDDDLLGSESDAPFESTFDGTYGLTNSLYYQSWELDAPVELKRVVVLLHDLGDHSAGWQPLVDYLYRRRFTIYAADLQGHGRSIGDRGVLPSLSELADDANALARVARRREGVKSVVFIGHGLGALVALEAAASATVRSVLGVVAIAPMFAGSKGSPRNDGDSNNRWNDLWGDTLGSVMGLVHPDYAVDRPIVAGELARNPSVAARLQRDRLVHTKLSAGGALMLDEVAQNVDKLASSTTLPLLVIQGDNDRISPLSATQAFVNRVATPAKSVTMKILADGRHRPLDDNNAEETFVVILNWLRSTFKSN